MTGNDGQAIFKPAFGEGTATTIISVKQVSNQIVIEGQQTTVNGPLGISINGLTYGFKLGDVVIPWSRFPVIDDRGEFVWQRKTDK